MITYIKFHRNPIVDSQLIVRKQNFGLPFHGGRGSELFEIIKNDQNENFSHLLYSPAGVAWTKVPPPAEEGRGRTGELVP